MVELGVNDVAGGVPGVVTLLFHRMSEYCLSHNTGSKQEPGGSLES